MGLVVAMKLSRGRELMFFSMAQIPIFNSQPQMAVARSSHQPQSSMGPSLPISVSHVA